MTPDQKRPSVAEVLERLKDFQRNTVDYVFKRLYLDDDQVSRFLIADEVGLGKTLVARGVIAKVVDHLWETKKRIDVVYICSNQDIARQNINRLNLPGVETFQYASRATLLPITTHQLKNKKLNFISLTPGTSFKLHSSGGIAEERVLLYFLLKDAWTNFDPDILSNILKLDVNQTRWNSYIGWFPQSQTIDQELALGFQKELEDSNLRQQFDDLAKAFDPRYKAASGSENQQRRYLIGQLRRLLARSSLKHLEPDLIILDEFQRFKLLLSDATEDGELAHELFRFEDAKVILLSATPYKMYTIYGEEEDNHYEDFKTTIEFLLGGDRIETDELFKSIAQFRHAFLWTNLDGSNQNPLESAKNKMEKILRRVMVRTEKLAVSENRNGMLQEFQVGHDDIRPSDIVSYVHLDRIAREIGADDQVEYWKSSAYPLNLMEDYKLKKQFEQARQSKNAVLGSLLQDAQPYLLNWADIESYKSIDPANARLRALLHTSVESNNWKCLWLPPSLPYYLPEGPFQGITPAGATKTLIFSAWRVVPKVISVLLSYEAERLMLQESERDFAYSELTRKKRRLLEFTASKERLTGMSVFTSLYPCLTLAHKIDPLAISKKHSPDAPLSWFIAFIRARSQVKKLLEQASLHVHISDTGAVDESWYWFAPLLLDRHFYRNEVGAFLDPQNGVDSWKEMIRSDGDDEDQQTRFAEHVDRLQNYWKTLPLMGRQPDDLLDILTTIAMAGPATSILRSLLRTLDVTDQFTPAVRYAAKAAFGFRTLFNQPDSTFLLQAIYPGKDYWQAVLKYCAQGNLQAVLDEYFHILQESLGLIGQSSVDAANAISAELRRASSLRAPSLRFDDIKVSEDNISSDQSHGIRCRYALRFGSDKNDENITRDVDVRIAFNSPFRPFVLATTSLGQEGLDFHQYCHRIMHWNLPTNPVDLEQREGRIHRYKGHVIRRNIVENYGYRSIEMNGDGLTDSWKQMFRKAKNDRSKSANDLIPFWIYEGGFKIERLIPVLPLSSEISRLKYLKKTLVAYRSVIGQPRQQELLESLSTRFSPEELGELSRKFSIDLSPPYQRI